jgi:uncharacterized Zn finger protein
MSVQYHAQIKCDGCGLRSLLFPNSTTARAVLKNDGWVRMQEVGDRDLCPACRPQPGAEALTNCRMCGLVHTSAECPE